MDIFELMGNPNFGKIYRGSHHVQNVVKNIIANGLDPSTTKLFRSIEIITDEEDRIAFRAPSLNHVFNRRRDENFNRYFERVIKGTLDPGISTLDDPMAGLGIQSGLRTSQTFTGKRTAAETASQMSSAVTSYYRRYFEHVAAREGATIRYRTFDTDPLKIADIYKTVGERNGENLGFILPGDATTGVVEMFDKTGRKMTQSEIFKRFGINPQDSGAAFKRFQALVNEQAISEVLDKGQRFKVGLFDPTDLFAHDPKTRVTFDALNKRGVFRGASPEETIANTRKAFQRMIDGQSFMSRTAFERRMQSLEAELDGMQSRLEILRKQGSASNLEYRQVSKEFIDLQRRIDETRIAVSKGESYNVRLVGGESIIDTNYVDELEETHSFAKGARVDFAKGDVIVQDDSVIANMLGDMKNFAHLSFDERMELAKEMDLLMSAADIKPELGLTDKTDSFMSLSKQGMPKTSYSNAITNAVFGEMINPVDASGKSYLARSLESSINEAVEEVRTGELKGGLMSIIEDYESMTPDDFATMEDYHGALDTQRYARRVRDFLAGGGDLSIDDVMTNDAMRIIRDHHFRFGRRKFGQTIQFAGENVPDLAVRVPMMGSTRAHILINNVGAHSASEHIMENRNMTIDIDYVNGSRFGLRGLDNSLIHAAFGGSDLDDALYTMYHYDTSTKRLFAMTLRDPNTMGEYMYFDANVINDSKNIPPSIRNISLQLHRDLIKLEKLTRIPDPTPSQQKEIQRLITFTDNMKKELDAFYMNDDSIQKVDLSKRYALDAETQAYNRTYAPKGWMVTDESLRRFNEWDPFRSLKTSQEVSEDIVSAMRRSMEYERTYQTSLPFEFVGIEHSDYFDRGFFKKYAPAGEATSGVLDSAKTITRAEAAAMSKGLLGRSINQSTVIDQFIRSHTHLGTAPDKEFIDKMTEILKQQHFTLIERESLIDAIVKTGDKTLIDAAHEILDENARGLGKVVALAQQQGLSAGLDPALFQQRFAKDAAQLRSFEAGYRSIFTDLTDDDSVVSRVLLSETDSLSDYSRLYGELLKQKEVFEETMKIDAAKTANQNLLDRLTRAGFDATTDERVRAEEFLQKYVQDIRDVTGKTPQELTQRLLGVLENPDVIDAVSRGEDISGLFGEFSLDEVNRRSLSRLQGWGLFDNSDLLNRQLLAISQVAAESFLTDPTKRVSALSALRQTTSAKEHTSVGDLYSRALRFQQQQIATDELQRVAASVQQGNGVDVLSEFITRDESGAIKYGKKMENVIDTVRRDQALLDALLNISRRNNAGADREVVQFLTDSLSQEAMSMGLPSSTYDDLLTLPTMAGSSTHVSLPPGAQRFLGREGADVGSQQVIKAQLQRTMKKMNMEELGKLLSVPGFRKGMAGAAIFAGLGIMHEVRGERTPEEMSGPPLLPGGSAYEGSNIGQTPYMGSIYSSVGNPGFPQGTTYRINTNSNMDPSALRDQITGVIDAPISGTIYQGRRSLAPSASSSMELLNLMFE